MIMADRSLRHSDARRSADAVSQPDFAKTGNASSVLILHHHPDAICWWRTAQIVRHIININAGNFHHLLLVINIFNR